MFLGLYLRWQTSKTIDHLKNQGRSSLTARAFGVQLVLCAHGGEKAKRRKGSQEPVLNHPSQKNQLGSSEPTSLCARVRAPFFLSSFYNAAHSAKQHTRSRVITRGGVVVEMGRVGMSTTVSLAEAAESRKYDRKERRTEMHNYCAVAVREQRLGDIWCSTGGRGEGPSLFLGRSFDLFS